MRDGHLNACKTCFGKSVRAYRRTPEGKAMAKREREKHAEKYTEWKRTYKKTDKGRASAARYAANSYNPARNGAQQAIKQALKFGRIQRLPCLICGEQNSMAHHPSYARDMRLAVTWLCVHHHNQLHNDFARELRS